MLRLYTDHLISNRIGFYVQSPPETIASLTETLCIVVAGYFCYPAMNHWLKTQSHPVRFLLYLEWGLLFMAIAFSFTDATAPTAQSAIAAISLEPRLLPQLWLPKALELLMLAVFALTGGILPSRRFATKMLYIGIQFSLVLAWLALSGQLWLLPVLLLIVVIRSWFLLALPGRWTLAGFVLAIMLLTRVQQLGSNDTAALFNQSPQDWLSQWSDVFWFAIVLLLLMQLMQYVLVAQQMQQQLAHEQQRWRQYTQQQEELTALKARHRIAYESYDALGHTLIAINIQLQSALKLWSIDPSQAQKFLAQAQHLGVTTMQEIRNCVRVLRMHSIPPRAELSCETKDQDTSQETQGCKGVGV
ncbi:MAG: histidine kinase dimerization/phosphoacceptor domain-containing protein [Brasilonema angustatum HA4187-MV1]|jgi:signal transduction histidine kinase|nr:histidine kinase dimerization/phosphoacceptor domain-containing protein [Brasilonema angustatum HA4187-MV1]